MINWIVKKGADLWTGLFLMIFSGAVIHEALDLEVGTPTNPGSGFMIFGTAVVLGVLALLQFLKALLSRSRRSKPRRRSICGGLSPSSVRMYSISFCWSRSGSSSAPFSSCAFCSRLMKRGNGLRP